jgi:hypothetical protein
MEAWSFGYVNQKCSTVAHKVEPHPIWRLAAVPFRCATEQGPFCSVILFGNVQYLYVTRSHCVASRRVPNYEITCVCPSCSRKPRQCGPRFVDLGGIKMIKSRTRVERRQIHMANILDTFLLGGTFRVHNLLVTV